MKQLACQFGQQQRLSGIITQPDNEIAAEQAVIFVSAGFSSASGPYRIYSELSFALAQCQQMSLRFDLGGVGDSVQIHSHLPLHLRTQRDLRAAIDYLASEWQVNQVILCGICSGAEDSFHYAEHDPRVIGLILIDPHCFRTWSWWIHHFFSLNFFYRVVVKLEKIIGFQSVRPLQAGINLSGSELIDYQYTTYSEAVRILEWLIKHKTLVHYIYTGGMRAIFNHKAQFKRMFRPLRLSQHVSVDFIPNIEHTQMLEQDRAQLTRIICERVKKIVASHHPDTRKTPVENDPFNTRHEPSITGK